MVASANRRTVRPIQNKKSARPFAISTRFGAEGDPLVIPVSDGEPVGVDEVWAHFAIPPVPLGTTCTNTVLWSCRSAHKERSANGVIDTAYHTEKMFTSIRSLDWQSFGTEPMPTQIGISGPSERHEQFLRNPGSSLNFGVLARGGGIFEFGAAQCRERLDPQASARRTLMAGSEIHD